jgi:uncharacterized protein (TIGR01244 family)
MAKGLPLSNQIFIGGLLDEQDLRTLAAEGVRAIVNLLPSGEDPAAPSPEAEGRLAEQLGLSYLHTPVPTSDARSPERVDEFIKGLARLPRPVYVHCKSGYRAGAYAAVALGVEQGLSGREALAHARQLGYDPRSPEMAEFIESQVGQFQEKTRRSSPR